MIRFEHIYLFLALYGDISFLIYSISNRSILILMVYSAFFHRLNRFNYCVVIICTIVCDASNALFVAFLFFQLFSWMP